MFRTFFCRKSAVLERVCASIANKIDACLCVCTRKAQTIQHTWAIQRIHCIRALLRCYIYDIFAEWSYCVSFPFSLLLFCCFAWKSSSRRNWWIVRSIHSIWMEICMFCTNTNVRDEKWCWSDDTHERERETAAELIASPWQSRLFISDAQILTAFWCFTNSVIRRDSFIFYTRLFSSIMLLISSIHITFSTGLANKCRKYFGPLPISGKHPMTNMALTLWPIFSQQ